MLVPYIIAENPDMKANEAITLSRKMMKGYKWRAFLYGLSFIGWTVIGMATLGVVGVLFVNPYKAAFYAEFYANVRAVYLEKNRRRFSGLMIHICMKDHQKSSLKMYMQMYLNL